MAGNATPNASAGESVSYGEIAAIERVLKSSFGLLDGASTPEHDPTDDAVYLELSSAIAEFTDCSGASFSDLYVLQKRNSQWAISQKVWDSHAHS